MHQLVHTLLHTSPLLIYLLVAVILLLESTGVPLVNNTLLLLLGAFASMGYLNIEMLIIAATVGSIAGACCAYWIGMRGGRRVLLRFAVIFHIPRQKIHVMDNWFHRSGFWMIFLSRMMPYIRPFACFPAGISHMDRKRFLLAASAGSIIWCIALPIIGWTLGNRWKIALYFLQRYTLPTLLIIVALIVVYVLVMRRVKRSVNARLHSSPTS